MVSCIEKCNVFIGLFQNKLFRGYIELEIQLREFDRCRTLYQKFLEFGQENCTTWLKFAELETLLGDVDRARSIYELAIQQPKLDMPEILWKAYIDFEIEQEQHENVRRLHERLLERTQNVKVWMSFAKFELAVAGSQHEDADLAVAAARAVYQRANRSLRSAGQSGAADLTTNKEERSMLLEAWQAFEMQYGDDKSRAAVINMMPKRVLQRRRIQTEDGSDAGWEEYFNYIFPEDEASKPNLKLLAMAKAWKKGKDVITGETGTSQSDSAPPQVAQVEADQAEVGQVDSDQANARQTEVDDQDDRDDSSESTSSDSDED